MKKLISSAIKADSSYWRSTLGVAIASVLIAGCDSIQEQCTLKSWIHEPFIAFGLAFGVIWLIARRHYKAVQNWVPLEDALAPKPPWVTIGIGIVLIVVVIVVLSQWTVFTGDCSTADSNKRFVSWIIGVIAGAGACFYRYNAQIKKI